VLRSHLLPLVDSFLGESRRRRLVARVRRRGDARRVPQLAEFPPMVMIDTTTRCNLACSFCPNSVLSGEAGFLGDMDRDLYFKLVDEIARESPGTILRPFDGGEPLMRKDLGEFIAYAKRKGIRRVSINTNGTILVRGRRRELIEAGLDHIEVSIDAHSAETYQRVRNSPLYDRVVENTLAYIEESKTADPERSVTVSFIEQMANRHERDAFEGFWAGRADHVSIREFHQHNGLVNVAGHVVEHATSARPPCPFLWNRIIVNHDGKVRFCEFDWKGEHALGDARVQTLKEIWHSASYRRLRQSHLDGTFDHPYCGPCEDWPSVSK